MLDCVVIRLDWHQRSLSYECLYTVIDVAWMRERWEDPLVGVVDVLLITNLCNESFFFFFVRVCVNLAIDSCTFPLYIEWIVSHLSFPHVNDYNLMIVHQLRSFSSPLCRDCVLVRGVMKINWGKIFSIERTREHLLLLYDQNTEYEKSCPILGKKV